MLFPNFGSDLETLPFPFGELSQGSASAELEEALGL